MKKILAVAAFVVGTIVAIGGCRAREKQPTPSPTAQTTINSFSITGSAATTDGITPIDPAIKAGEFFLSWNISSSEPYYVALYLSNDATLVKEDAAGNKDVEFDTLRCSTLNNFDPCTGAQSGTRCEFTNQNTLHCPQLNFGIPWDVDISSFLNQIPKTANIIIEACNAPNDSCKTATVAVQFR